MIAIMKAGRELDALVAEQVMKLAGVGYYRRVSAVTSAWELCQRGDVTSDHPTWKASLYYNHGTMPHHLTSVPRFSTDIAAAWEVVEKLQASFYVTVEKVGEQWDCSFCQDVPTMHRAQMGYAEADTAPLAICLAALKAVRYEEK